MRDDDSKEEQDLKNKKKNADANYADNLKQYDDILEEWRRNKKQLKVFF